ncbi:MULTISPECIES: MFS transporter [unclassified Pseudoclavibacter]|uniref:MFS transporter n=1 Tax=unclassified Pseudoclavibacter TaxID=2615177 RepID=UPI001BAD445D|nr:MFS transporter [Pseudoclavibacter sp. Marseille-Q4354]MBS3180312.1 YbfB/YjiJ family MFS transporter [Pseudoclavibacter sp. Marseille-Q4354]
MKRTFSFGDIFQQSRGQGTRQRRSQRLLVVGGVGLIAACYGLVRLAYGLYLPDVEAELGLDASMAGVVSGGASAMYCAAAIAGFFLAGRMPRILVAGAASTAGGGALGMALASQVEGFAAFAIVSSAGAGLASPALVELLRRAVSGDRGQRLQVVVNAGTGPGLVLAGALAMLLLPDWRLAWAAAAVVTFLSAFAVLTSTALPSTALPSTALPSSGRARHRDASAAVPPRAWFGQHLRVICAALLLGAGSAAVWTFGRTVLVDGGASGDFSALAWMCLGLGGALVLPLSAAVRRLGSTRAWMLTALVVAASTALIGLFPGVRPLALLACVAFGWGYTAATGALITWTSEIDERRASAGTALLFVVLVLGQGLGAALAGWGLAAATPGLVFVVAAALSAAAIVPARPVASIVRVP